jgi:hypothetical protein
MTTEGDGNRQWTTVVSPQHEAIPLNRHIYPSANT